MQKKTECSTFKISTCETFLKVTKISSFFKKKTQKLCILEKNPMNEKVSELFITSLYQIIIKKIKIYTPLPLKIKILVKCGVQSTLEAKGI